MAVNQGLLITLIILAVIFVVALILLCKGVKVVHQGTCMIVERLGAYHKTLRPGIAWINPIIDSPRKVDWRYLEADIFGSVREKHDRRARIDMREHVLDFEEQRVITKDNVMISIDALAYFRITDPKAATFNIQNLPVAIELLVQSTLRNIVARITLDDTFSSRESINAELLEKIHLDAERWGVSITRVEIQNIVPPPDIKKVMESQIKSERTRRSQVLQADGGRVHSVITSRGDVARRVLEAEGIRASAITLAEGEAAARLMAAEAEKKSLELIAAALEGTGVKVTDFMVAQQYLTVLSQMIANGSSDRVIMLPTSSVVNIESIVKTNAL